ncbi:hypothetical protein E2C01_016837 [Portunus trituberculatus]|uniref:Uncharacterized protein n=1 Tax=Portunus trituberculatus TaxID=210409 RepID=A0A5B7DRA8_PORTR|nr:hypothetical protein [Portunus trituberculatus]
MPPTLYPKSSFGICGNGTFDMSHSCGFSDERIQQLLAEETVDLIGEITFTEGYEPVTADLAWLAEVKEH